MWKFIIKRLLMMIPQIFILSMLVFSLSRFMPGDPVLSQLVNEPNVTQAQIDEKRNQLGLNDPIQVQYVKWMTNALQGNFGTSYQNKLPVSELVGRNILNTFFLGLMTLLITYLISIPLGILAGRYQGSFLDKCIVSYNYFTLAMPTFIFALILLFIFGYRLGWFPTSGTVGINIVEGSIQFYLSKMQHTILPALTMSLLSTTVIVQYLRNEIIDVKQRDFIKTVRAKGATDRELYRRHIIRNSLLPIASFSGISITSILAGNIFIETIFGYQGMGQLFISALSQRDYPIVTAIVLISGTMALFGTLLSDIIMGAVDPRIRL